MPNKLSYSKISNYSLCGQRYNLHYNHGLREKWQRSSLLFGSAIDEALNNLLATRDLEKSLSIFNKKWAFGFVHGKYESLVRHPDIIYSERDLDEDLVDVDSNWIKEFRERKSNTKWANLPEEDRSKYNEYNWNCLKLKGEVILRDYCDKVLPQFISVEGIQHESHLTNSEGDTVVQYLDFIATLQDGSKILFDNKTTTSLMYYDDESAGSSQQLISYYYNNKKKFGLTGVGYVAMQKTLLKNKKKICSKCGVEGSSSKAKTCDVEYPDVVVKRGKEVEGSVRCDGEWNVTIKPECAIKIIVNPVTEAAEDLVLTTFDEANNGIKNENWYRNLSVCKSIYGSPCQFQKLCWKGSDEDLVKEEKK